MGYFEKIFFKTKEEFTIIDLEEFFSSEQEETAVLEFKDGRVAIEGICKEITAFLNTEGGLLIIGAPEEIKKGNKKICTGSLTYTSVAKNKTALLQKISSRIVPAPLNLKVFEHHSDIGNIFVIDVPQSTIPPHQYSEDSKYYIRLEEEAKPAPHGLVQALFMKRRYPTLGATLMMGKKDEKKIEMEVKFNNHSDIPADQIAYIIELRHVRAVSSTFKFHHTYDSDFSNFSLSEKLDIPLVKQLKSYVNFDVFHGNSEFLLFIGIWSKDVPFQGQKWLFNPSPEKDSSFFTLLSDEDFENKIDEFNEDEKIYLN